MNFLTLPVAKTAARSVVIAEKNCDKLDEFRATRRFHEFFEVRSLA
jgi:hypothetical protein